jgi:excinuclease ABC subunit B
LRRLVDIQYERNDVDFHRGSFRVRGDVVEVFPVYENETAIRIEFFGDEIEAMKEVDPLRGKVKGEIDRYSIFPGSHYVTPQQQMRAAIESIASSCASVSISTTRRGGFSRSSASSSARCTTSR